jgi:hypothetical protein
VPAESDDEDDDDRCLKANPEFMDVFILLGLLDEPDSAGDAKAKAHIISTLKAEPEYLDTFRLLGLVAEPVEEDAVDRKPDVQLEATTLRVCWADLVDSEYDDEYEQLHDCDWTSETALLAGGAGSPKRTKRQKQRMRKSFRQAAAKAAAVEAVAS